MNQPSLGNSLNTGSDQWINIIIKGMILNWVTCLPEGQWLDIRCHYGMCFQTAADVGREWSGFACQFSRQTEQTFFIRIKLHQNTCNRCRCRPSPVCNAFTVACGANVCVHWIRNKQQRIYSFIIQSGEVAHQCIYNKNNNRPTCRSVQQVLSDSTDSLSFAWLVSHIRLVINYKSLMSYRVHTAFALSNRRLVYTRLCSVGIS